MTGPKEYLIRPLNGKVILPDSSSGVKLKHFVVSYSEPILIRDFVQQLVDNDMPNFEIQALEDVTVIVEDKKDGISS